MHAGLDTPFTVYKPWIKSSSNQIAVT